MIPGSADTEIATSSMKLNKFAFDKQQKNQPPISFGNGRLSLRL
jgi:hypothetical protein